MTHRKNPDCDWCQDPDPWPLEPPAELLEALDHAAARLSELDARGVSISLGIGNDGGARAHLCRDNGLTHEIDPAELLQLVCGNRLDVSWASIA